MRRYTKNIHRNTRINKQDRQKITFPGYAYPKEIPQQYTPATHTVSSALPEGPLGGLPSLSLTTKGSRIHLGGRVAKPLISPLTPVPRIIFGPQATSLTLTEL